MAIIVLKNDIGRSIGLRCALETEQRKTAQVIAGNRVSSVKNLYEYDCKRGRRRMLATARFSGQMGKVAAVDGGYSPTAWESVGCGNYTAHV
jgi:hypothetical protein